MFCVNPGKTSLFEQLVSGKLVKSRILVDSDCEPWSARGATNAINIDSCYEQSVFGLLEI